MNGNELTWKNYGIKDLVYSQPVFTCSKSTMEKAQLWVKHVDDKHTRTSDVSIINFEKISLPGVPSVDFEQVTAI